jgi:hypothetical protein
VVEIAALDRARSSGAADHVARLRSAIEAEKGTS